MQMHQHYDLLLENASAAGDEGPCPLAGAMAAGTDNGSYDDTMHKQNNVATSSEESPFEKEDKQLHDANVMHRCTLCNHAEMLPLDYFRHMSLGHGVKYFCGHCEKFYKQKKPVVLHHKRCHSGLQLLVRSYEDNKLKDITLQIQLDQGNGVQDDAEIKSVDVVSATKPVARVDCRHITSLSTALHYSRSKKRDLLTSCAKDGDQDIHCKERINLERFGNLELIPVGKKNVTSDKQKIQDCPGSLGTTKQPHKPSETKQLDQANTSSTVDVQCIHGDKIGTELLGGRKSLHSGPAGCRGKPLKEDEEKAQQPTNDCKPLYCCGHCMKHYKLLKPLITHQKSVHPELKIAVKMLDMSKLDDVTSDVMEKNYKEVCTATDAKSGRCISAQEDTSCRSFRFLKSHVRYAHVAEVRSQRVRPLPAAAGTATSTAASAAGAGSVPVPVLGQDEAEKSGDTFAHFEADCDAGGRLTDAGKHHILY
ncbi:hypothetical protein V5799_022649 [Amblyomma americanum]|uniref:C2H2-type domain-containing protein n=1 Tax=Amblyomma americanum TaxID=6943 RepID=A0AAQ4FLF6_AMBAM